MKILAELPSLAGYRFMTSVEPVTAFAALQLCSIEDGKRLIQDISLVEAERIAEVIPLPLLFPLARLYYCHYIQKRRYSLFLLNPVQLSHTAVLFCNSRHMSVLLVAVVNLGVKCCGKCLAILLACESAQTTDSWKLSQTCPCPFQNFCGSRVQAEKVVSGEHSFATVNPLS